MRQSKEGLIKNYILNSKYAKEYISNNINTDANHRWENGIPHHQKSKELMKHIKELDICFMDDYFCWKSGGDGDNGEFLMYLLDMYFELQDIKSYTKK